MITHSFDPHSPAKLQPRPTGKRLDCMACMITFSHVIESYVLDRYPCQAFAQIEQSSGPLTLYAVEYQGGILAFCRTTIGAPAAAGLLEEAAMRVNPQKFVVFGGSGCLNREIVHGKVTVPTFAWRDEGTSYHYAPPADTIQIKNAGIVAAFFESRGVPYAAGGTWTTDAIFRETESLFAQRKAQGCISVEMEYSALQAVCDFRGYELYGFLTSGDLLDAPSWDPRSSKDNPTGTQHDTTHFELAAELARFVSQR